MSFLTLARLLPVILPVILVATVGPPASADRRAASWEEQVQQVSASLEEGQYQQALSAARALVEEMARRSDDGKGRELFGSALANLALAEAGTGEVDEAVWHWSIALAFQPSLAEVDLTGYGEPGELLRRRLAEERAVAIDIGNPEPVSEKPPPGDAKGQQTRPPRKLRARMDPRMSLPKRRGQVVQMQMIIDRDGRLLQPKLLSYSSAGAAFWAAESVRRWRFAPAERAGEPYPVYYHLTVDLGSAW